jgi:uncharacterized protein
MLILLPPSETKRPGGDGAPWPKTEPSFPSLRRVRTQVVRALVELSADADAAARVLKLSERQRGDIAANRALRRSPTLPAVDRYTGVLFDALDAGSLDDQAREWLGAQVAIQSAPFGPVGALDLIPTYRLAAGTSIPGLPPLRRLWADAAGAAIAASEPSFVLDLRSEAYVALGPVPAGVPQAYVRVVTDSGDGVVRALNHFNKHAKGDLVRALAQSRPDVDSLADLVAWGSGADWEFRDVGDGVVELVV